MARVGFLINPVAGMGGRVGLKGTDDVVAEALARGAEPVAPAKAVETLETLHCLLEQEAKPPELEWLTCSGKMGAGALRAAGFSAFEVVYDAAKETAARDTRAAVERFLEAGVDLILFCGGDGTARDICSVAKTETPILGIPSGVKMYSGVFGVTAARTAEVLLAFLKGELSLAETEVLDLDEERYRRGEWAVRLYHAALTPHEPTYTQSAKALISENTDADVWQDIAADLREAIESDPDTLFILGPGTTVQGIAVALDVEKTLLGIDALLGERLVGRNLDERGLLALLERHPRSRLVLSPIGAQGFVIGRGNLELSPDVIRRIGTENLIVVATPAKLAHTPLLRFDTGDAGLDAEFAAPGYLPVVTGYRRRRLVKLAA